MGWCALVSPFASCGDYLYLTIGYICAVGFGASLPGFCLFFGEMINSLGSGSNYAI